MSSLSCRLCGQPIKFDEKWVSERTGKKVPLDPGTNEPHDPMSYTAMVERNVIQCAAVVASTLKLEE